MTMLERKELPFELQPVIMELEGFIEGTMGSKLLVEIHDYRVGVTRVGDKEFAIDIYSIVVDIVLSPIHIAALLLNNGRELSEKSIIDVEGKMLREKNPTLNLAPSTDVLREGNRQQLNQKKYRFKRVIKNINYERRDSLSHRFNKEDMKYLLLMDPGKRIDPAQSHGGSTWIDTIDKWRENKILTDKAITPKCIESGPPVAIPGGFSIVRSVLFVRKSTSSNISQEPPLINPGIPETMFFFVNVLRKQQTHEYYVDIRRGTDRFTSKNGYTLRFYVGTVELANEYVKNVPISVEGGSYKHLWESHPQAAARVIVPKLITNSPHDMLTGVSPSIHKSSNFTVPGSAPNKVIKHLSQSSNRQSHKSAPTNLLTSPPNVSIAGQQAMLTMTPDLSGSGQISSYLQGRSSQPPTGPLIGAFTQASTPIHNVLRSSTTPQPQTPNTSSSSLSDLGIGNTSVTQYPPSNSHSSALRLQSAPIAPVQQMSFADGNLKSPPMHAASPIPVALLNQFNRTSASPLSNQMNLSGFEQNSYTQSANPQQQNATANTTFNLSNQQMYMHQQMQQSNLTGQPQQQQVPRSPIPQTWNGSTLPISVIPGQPEIMNGRVVLTPEVRAKLTQIQPQFIARFGKPDGDMQFRIFLQRWQNAHVALHNKNMNQQAIKVSDSPQLNTPSINAASFMMQRGNSIDNTSSSQINSLGPTTIQVNGVNAGRDLTPNPGTPRPLTQNLALRSGSPAMPIQASTMHAQQQANSTDFTLPNGTQVNAAVVAEVQSWKPDEVRDKVQQIAASLFSRLNHAKEVAPPNFFNELPSKTFSERFHDLQNLPQGEFRDRYTLFLQHSLHLNQLKIIVQHVHPNLLMDTSSADHHTSSQAPRVSSVLPQPNPHAFNNNQQGSYLNQGGQQAPMVFANQMMMRPNMPINAMQQNNLIAQQLQQQQQQQQQQQMSGMITNLAAPTVGGVPNTMTQQFMFNNGQQQLIQQPGQVQINMQPRPNMPGGASGQQAPTMFVSGSTGLNVNPMMMAGGGFGVPNTVYGPGNMIGGNLGLAQHQQQQHQMNSQLVQAFMQQQQQHHHTQQQQQQLNLYANVQHQQQQLMAAASMRPHLQQQNNNSGVRTGTPGLGQTGNQAGGIRPP